MGNLLTTLLLSQGVPMLLAGDEFGRTQGGNNNPYCQDSEIGWLDWDISAEGEELLAFTRELLRLRREHIVFHRARFFGGCTIPGTEVKDVTWLRADGREMGEGDWGDPDGRRLCLLLCGEAGLMHLTARGDQETDDTFLLVMNASHEEVGQLLPAGGEDTSWQVLVDTAQPAAAAGEERLAAGAEIRLPPRSTRLLVQCGAA
jgi:glycogen operon protein